MDDLKLKFEKFQSSSKSLTELIASQTNNKHGLGYLSSEDDSERNFMPPKPDLVYNTAPLAVESDHSAFNVQTKPTPRNSTHRGCNKQYASFTKKYSQKPKVPVAVLLKSKPVSIAAVRQLNAVVSKIMKSRPNYAYTIVTKSISTIRRYKTCSQSSKTSNSSPKVTTAKALMVSDAKGKKGKWVWRPTCPILDHDSRTIGASMTLK
nr:hypothetical protein [Tanacetum cinerariifolium]